jgi:hypothetical protein
MSTSIFTLRIHPQEKLNARIAVQFVSSCSRQRGGLHEQGPSHLAHAYCSWKRTSEEPDVEIKSVKALVRNQ